MNFQEFIHQALQEDIGDGDYSTLCCIPANEKGKAILKVKESGILAGVEVAKDIIALLDPEASFTVMIPDGTKVQTGDLVFELSSTVHTILKSERLLLNIMQRMSGIATLTNTYAELIKDYPCKLLDTRKTTPNFRWFEKRAVVIGGGYNHRMGLYDMIMLKDNHIDYCGGIEKAIEKANLFLQEQQLHIPIEVETRSLDDVKRVMKVGGIQRIMLDNFTPEQITEAVAIINKQYETEASGGINLDTIQAYAATGVDFISAGAIIHHATSLDLSLKAVIA